MIPSGWVAVALAVVLLVLVAWYLSFSAARLDRLHARVEGAWSALDAQLVRRSAVALELATSGLLDPASSVLLAAAAHTAREVAPEAERDGDEREAAESDLSAALRACLPDEETVGEITGTPPGPDLIEELRAAAARVPLARRFHNDAVRAGVAVRRKRVVRWFRLAGRAPQPESFEIDDAPPPPFAR